MQSRLELCPAASRLALLVMLVVTPPGTALAWMIEDGATDLADIATVGAMLAVCGAMGGYVLAGLAGLLRWVHRGFASKEDPQALGRIWNVVKVSMGGVVLFFALAYLRYEVVAVASFTRVQYYLVWDRLTGNVEVQWKRLEADAERPRRTSRGGCN